MIALRSFAQAPTGVAKLNGVTGDYFEDEEGNVLLSFKGEIPINKTMLLLLYKKMIWTYIGKFDQDGAFNYKVSL